MEADWKWWLGQVVVGVAMLVLAIAGVWQCGKRWEAYGFRQGVLYMQAEAAKRGYAEYGLDELNEMEWRWR